MTAEVFNFDNSYLKLPNELYSLAQPTAVQNPHVIIINEKLADSLGINLKQLTKTQQAQLFSGNTPPPGTTSFCQAYAGHQYAHFTMLGDGRTHVIGEHISPQGIRVDCQLKGSGPTPILAAVMGVQRWARCFANTSFQRPCSLSVSQPQEVWRSCNRVSWCNVILPCQAAF